jgi:hypothetical protein
VAKQEVRVIQGKYNLNLMAVALPAVMFVITMATSIEPVMPMASGTRSGYKVNVKEVPTTSEAATSEVRILESKGASRPGSRMHTDPFTGETHPLSATAKTERSMVTSIRADVAEGEAYKAALSRGEIGIQRPTGANVTGTDFITAVRKPGTNRIREVVITDVKATVSGRFPVPKTTIRGSWLSEVQHAVAQGRLVSATRPLKPKFVRRCSRVVSDCDKLTSIIRHR